MDIVGFVILSVFCIGGLYAYSAEALRLQRLLAAGKRTKAKILGKDKIDSGSESVVHYIIEYEFTDSVGSKQTHEADLNNCKFFDKLTIGQEIEIIYTDRPRGVSHPLSLIESDLRKAKAVNGLLLVFWAVMAVILI